jgi:hypothetical protein
MSCKGLHISALLSWDQIIIVVIAEMLLTARGPLEPKPPAASDGGGESSNDPFIVS